MEAGVNKKYFTEMKKAIGEAKRMVERRHGFSLVPKWIKATLKPCHDASIKAEFYTIDDDPPLAFIVANYQHGFVKLYWSWFNCVAMWKVDVNSYVNNYPPRPMWRSFSPKKEERRWNSRNQRIERSAIRA